MKQFLYIILSIISTQLLGATECTKKDALDFIRKKLITANSQLGVFDDRPKGGTVVLDWKTGEEVSKATQSEHGKEWLKFYANVEKEGYLYTIQPLSFEPNKDGSMTIKVIQFEYFTAKDTGNKNEFKSEMIIVLFIEDGVVKQKSARVKTTGKVIDKLGKIVFEINSANKMLR